VDLNTIIADFLITSGVATSAGVLFKRWLDKKAGEQSAKAIIDAAEVYDELNRLGAALDTDRIAIIYTSNGGGIPSASTPLHLTFLYEIVRGATAAPLRPLVTNLPIDLSLITILKSTLTEGFWRAKDADKLPNGFIRDILIASNEHQCHIYQLKVTKNKYYLLFVAWSKDPNAQHSDEEINLFVQTSLAKLSSLLK
jgi:hypothetical protein